MLLHSLPSSFLGSSSVFNMSSASAVASSFAGRVQVVRASCGVEAWLVEDYTVPLISVEFSFLNGASHDPQGRSGLAHLLAELLDEGAGDLSSEAFQDALEERAIGLSFYADSDTVDGTMRVLQAQIRPAFALLGLALTKPRFDPDAIERRRDQAITSIKYEESNPDKRLYQTLAQLAFQGHPYQRDDDGTIEELQTITREELVQAHRTFLTREALRIVVVGAISAAQLGEEIDVAFGALPQKADLSPISMVDMQNQGRKEIVNFDVPQSSVLLALPGLSRKDPDFMAASVMNHILGGGSFTSRFWQEIREKRGLAYSVWSRLSPRRYGALYLAGTSTSNERVGESYRLMREEMTKMASLGASQEELIAAQAYITGAYALGFDTSQKIARKLLSMWIDELGIHYMDQRNREIEAVTLADVNRVAARLLSAEPLTVVVGQPQGL